MVNEMGSGTKPGEKLLDCPNEALLAYWRTYSDAELMASAMNLCLLVVQDAESGEVRYWAPYHARGVRAFLEIMADRIGDAPMQAAQAALLSKPYPFRSEDNNGKS